ncbi:MAG: type II CAAX prenyl endopeptidase Rce1 family protein [Gaiellaceae bacterium]|jgi:membrane protease YdiL (CAAX protease family)
MTSPLAAWTTFVVAFATLSYSLRFSEGKPPEDFLYRWSTAVGGLIQFAVIGLVVYAIAGLGNRRELLALRRPTSWRRAAGIALGIGIVMVILSATLGRLLDPGGEQGVTPDTWQPEHAAAYIANGLVICVVAPFVEELAFRGLGYSVLVRFGRWLAIILVGFLFGLAHGLVEALPFLAALGAGLAYLRSRVDSVIPGMIVHGLFNATALTVAVSGKPAEETMVRACTGVCSLLSLLRF